MRDEAILLLGLGALAVLLTRRGGSGAIWGAGWHWPVPDLMVRGVRYPAEISSGFRSTSRPTHHGVDVMYRRRSVSDMLTEYPTGVKDAGGAKQHRNYFAPVGTPILAAKDGTIWATGESAKGKWVVIDHGAPWATAYFHLASVAVPAHRAGKQASGAPAVAVRAGQQIGTMGHDPEDVYGLLRHLHFEAWYKGGDSKAAQDPASNTNWERSAWTKTT